MAVVEATLDELAEQGYAALRIERVATRAGVNKTTIYRRWPTREVLVADAILRTGTPAPAVLPDTGSLLGDLLAAAHLVVPVLGSERAAAITRVIVLATEPLLRAIGERLWEVRLAALALLLERAAGRAEIPNNVDPALVLDLIMGATTYRLLRQDTALDIAFVNDVVRAVVTGLTQSTGEPRAGT